jgi:hypothetical protein
VPTNARLTPYVVLTSTCIATLVRVRDGARAEFAATGQPDLADKTGLLRVAAAPVRIPAGFIPS